MSNLQFKFKICFGSFLSKSDFSWVGNGTFPQNMFAGPIRSHTVKENLISKAINEILRYRHTRTYRHVVDIMLFLYEDVFLMVFINIKIII